MNPNRGNNSPAWYSTLATTCQTQRDVLFVLVSAFLFVLGLIWVHKVDVNIEVKRRVNGKFDSLRRFAFRPIRNLLRGGRASPQSFPDVSVRDRFRIRSALSVAFLNLSEPGQVGLP